MSDEQLLPITEKGAPSVTLRVAAKMMRDQHGPDHERHAMWSAMADWLDDIAERHKPDPEPAELVLHYDEECPTGECEDPGYHTVTACWGCYPTHDGMEGRSVYPCIETKAALKVADAYLTAGMTTRPLPPGSGHTS